MTAADAVATPDGLRVLLVTANSGDGSQRHLCVVTVNGDPTAVPPGVSAAQGVWHQSLLLPTSQAVLVAGCRMHSRLHAFLQ